jgi:release factor glutamine methyltransferase
MPRSVKPLGFRLRVGSLQIGEDENHRAPRILDVGTGSGAIAISIAHDWSEAEITAIDSSAPALAIARENATRYGVTIRFLEGGLLTPVANEEFEIIVSNPPYVPESDRPTLSVEVRDHEPALALFAGPDGLDIYRRLIPQAFGCLVSGGYLVLEIGYGQSEAVRDLLTASAFQNIEFQPDLQGIPRVASAQHP